MTESTTLISIKNVSKTFGADILDLGPLVLKDINLDIKSGEFLIIFGPSGSGKSTLLNLLAGLEKPTVGQVLVHDRDLTLFTGDELAEYHRTQMGIVFQSFNLIKSLNVWENVALPQTANGVNYRERHDRAQFLLNLLNLGHFTYRHPNELSGGEQQRVAIARALVNNPIFLLVDEPTGNLDTQSADDVMQILHGLHHHAAHTIVLVTHNPEYLGFATRVIYLQDGKIIRQQQRTHLLATIPKSIDEERLKSLANYRQLGQKPATAGAQTLFGDRVGPVVNQEATANAAFNVREDGKVIPETTIGKRL